MGALVSIMTDLVTDLTTISLHKIVYIKICYWINFSDVDV